LFWLLFVLFVIAGFTAVGPSEKTLGSNVRIVYLHGAWVWAAMAAFLAAAVIGLAGLVLRRQALHLWSRALGRTGLFFWITYLPISMWAMQTNWNGLFLAEPRWRLAVVFAVSGLLMQIGLALVEDHAWASAVNLFFASALILALQNTQNVMHPPAPILNSDTLYIQSYFTGLLLLTLMAVWQIARWWYHRDLSTIKSRPG
jgi:hypothetical protein